MKAITHKVQEVEVFTIDKTPKGVKLARDVLKAVASNWGMSEQDICGTCRKQIYVRARADVAQTLRDKLHLNLSEIGHVMNRHHTSVMALLGRRGNKSGSGL